MLINHNLLVQNSICIHKTIKKKYSALEQGIKNEFCHQKSKIKDNN